MEPTGMLHPGEMAVQDLAHEADRGRPMARMLSPTIPDRFRPILETQHWLAIGSVDADGMPWASVLFGSAEGWAVPATGGASVSLDLGTAPIHAADVLDQNLRDDPRLAILAVDLATRKRIRINGRVTRRTDDRLDVAVEQAFPNCPKYIQRRIASPAVASGSSSATPSLSSRLGPDQRRLITAADTCFVASVNRDAGADVSHRGGPPGFVRCEDGDQLRMPDYPGNSLFNTLGNLHRTPRAGLTFVDFADGRVLQVAGSTTLDFGPPPADPDPTEPTGGTGRWWALRVETVRDWRLPAALNWSFIDASPYNPPPAA
ncbi:MAG: pyridoxamine 5'-phosphate oxidase family protein [Planctomycetota bacterium]